MATFRRTGRNGMILAQMSVTAVVGETLVGNAAPETVNGVTYPAHSVFTAAHSLWVDSPAPDFTETIAAPVDHQTKQVLYELGKVIYTPALGAADTVEVDYSYANVAHVGNMTNWKMDIKRDIVDVTAFMDGYHVKVATFLDWSGSAEEYQTDDYWFNACSQNDFFYVTLYPDQANDEYFVGRAIIDYGLDVAWNSAVKGSIKFNGTGSISYVTA